MPKVQIYFPIDETGESYEQMREVGIDLVDAAVAGSSTPDLIHADVDLVSDIDAAAGIVRPISAETMAKAPSLRLIANYTVGYDNVDLKAATAQGVLVTNSPTENNWAGVAEGTMAILLTQLKKIRERDRHVKAGGWREPALEGRYIGARDIDDYPGITIGLIGFGRIAKRLAELLVPWRVNVVAHALNRDDPDYERLGVTWVDFETLLRQSDVVSVHCNLTEETVNLVGAAELAMMKPDALLINTARGPIVDLDALTQALKEDRIAGAALDVFPQEPPDFDHPIFSLGDRVLLSPHMVANNVGSGLQLAVPSVTEAIMSALAGDVPDNVVNPEAIPHWQNRFGGKALI